MRTLSFHLFFQWTGVSELFSLLIALNWHPPSMERNWLLFPLLVGQHCFPSFKKKNLFSSGPIHLKWVATLIPILSGTIWLGVLLAPLQQNFLLFRSPMTLNVLCLADKSQCLSDMTWLTIFLPVWNIFLLWLPGHSYLLNLFLPPWLFILGLPNSKCWVDPVLRS